MTSTAPRLPLPIRALLSPTEGQAGAAMDRFIDQIVRRSIRHAQLMLRQGSYNWPVARLALRKILSDLEARAPEDPGVLRLRAFIASKDREWLREKR